jgi:hypothetical protein
MKISCAHKSRSGRVRFAVQWTNSTGSRPRSSSTPLSANSRERTGDRRHRPLATAYGDSRSSRLLIGVYTLVGRDRKSPYLINSVFAVFLICILGAALDVASVIVESLNPSASRWLLTAGIATLLIAILVTTWHLWTIYVRFAYFVDPGGWARLKLLPGLRQFRAWRKQKGGLSYEHDPVPLGPELKQKVSKIILDAAGAAPVDDTQARLYDDPASRGIKAEVRDHQDPRSLAMALRHQGQANQLLGDLCLAFLREPDHYVQYMTASRHPIEFVDHLRASIGQAGALAWQQVRERIVVVDAYTPHFGFLDTINEDKSAKLRKDMGDRLLSSTETYAGLHSSSSAAFKRIKKAGGADKSRKPTLIIYEDMYALSDLESVEQYRLFVRHVIPSERLWDGMFTVFAETAQKEDDWKLVSS